MLDDASPRRGWTRCSGRRPPSSSSRCRRSGPRCVTRRWSPTGGTSSPRCRRRARGSASTSAPWSSTWWPPSPTWSGRTWSPATPRRSRARSRCAPRSPTSAGCSRRGRQGSQSGQRRGRAVARPAPRAGDGRLRPDRRLPIAPGAGQAAAHRVPPRGPGHGRRCRSPRRRRSIEVCLRVLELVKGPGGGEPAGAAPAPPRPRGLGPERGEAGAGRDAAATRPARPAAVALAEAAEIAAGLYGRSEPLDEFLRRARKQSLALLAPRTSRRVVEEFRRCVAELCRSPSEPRPGVGCAGSR